MSAPTARPHPGQKPGARKPGAGIPGAHSAASKQHVAADVAHSALEGARVVAPEPPTEENRWRRALREIATGNGKSR